MEIATRFLGKSSSTLKNGDEDAPISSSRSNSKYGTLRPMRTHSYVRFMERYNPGSRVSLYDKIYGFANSPLKRVSRIKKHKRQSLEITRSSTLEQREQYRRLIADYRASNLDHSTMLAQKSPLKIKHILNDSIIDLTGHVSSEGVSERVKPKGRILQAIEEKWGGSNPTNIALNHKNGYAVGKTATPGKLIYPQSKYLFDNFIPRINETYNFRARQRQLKICAEEKRSSLLHEKLEAKKALLDEQFTQQLTLKDKNAKEPSKLPEITPEMNDVINRAFVPYPPQEILSEDFNISITREHMATLLGLNWLNDEIVNFYMELIVQRSKEKETLPSVHAMNTFFYPKLSRQGYNSVRRWTKKVDIFAKDMVLYPIHLGVHWCLAVIDFTKKEIRYYDSMGGENNECLETLKNYLVSEHKNKKGTDYDVSDWKLTSMMKIPQQMNGSDCGVFACKFAEYNSINRDLTFEQDDMPCFRRAMVWEILNKKLLQ